MLFHFASFFSSFPFFIIISCENGVSENEEKSLFDFIIVLYHLPKGGKYKLAPTRASSICWMISMQFTPTHSVLYGTHKHNNNSSEKKKRRETLFILLYTYVIIFIPNWFRKRPERLVYIPVAVATYICINRTSFVFVCRLCGFCGEGKYIFFFSAVENPNNERRKKFQLMFTK